ncbi:adenylate cyclase [Caballeronia sordidicola]|uniref:Adenylate cyclase n=1 Tax=Caballeronia sordidicola TaxID=196367 RepID=A0A158IBT6_CABSO|nr:CYTH domain-containing protein [Caballeronia sordidicola]SAL54025.1 adenylate cyclase [Caballeronia sordidicola]
MSIEREIKLALPTSNHDEIAKDLTKRTGQEGQKIHLTNVYFDTANRALAKAKSALRLRGAPGQWLQTYKTAGESADGMHSRHEWEMPVAGEALEVDKLLEHCDDEHARNALRNAAPELTALFRTDFDRVIWNVEIDGARIEAVLDLGEVITDINGARRTTPISELELELKSGEEAGLTNLAAQMRGAFLYLQPENASKAQRGYELCNPKAEGSNGGVK